MMGESEEGEYVLHVQARGFRSVDRLETGDESCGFRAALIYN
jgi:tRNA(Phe) wybutosine-synthesizing methylase Tyw3